jgi:hypothetical protein
MTRRILLATLAVLAPLSAAAQTAAPKKDVAVAPIECWWKTDRSAIRVGEHFQLTLTCAVLDTDKVKVAVDESSLAPSALHLVPFEIVSGDRFRDISNSPRRFFQYEYTMRLLGEEFFGKEIPLPRLEVSYRVQNALGGGAALSGREAQYSLRPIAIRVLSVVPKDAADIRDTPPDTFGDVDRRLFRSNLLIIGAGVALALALLLIVVVLVRATVKQRAAAATRKLVVAPGTVLRAASRELSAVHAASQQDGWNGELAGRAAAALRLAGAVALARPVGQRPAARDAAAGEGQIAIRRGFRGKKIMLSASVTPHTVQRNGRRSGGAGLWEGISQTLATFSAVRYSRNGTPDGPALDAALAEGQDLVRRLRRYQLIRFGRATPTAAETAKQTWAR